LIGLKDTFGNSAAHNAAFPVGESPTLGEKDLVYQQILPFKTVVKVSITPGRNEEII
jgi:hypothetical protein